MDADIDELRDLVKKNMELTQETHKMVRGMRNSARWGRFFTIVWWIVVVAVSGAAYYYYLAPYVQKAEQIYSQVAQNSQQAQGLGQQISNFLNQFNKQTH